MDSTALKKAIIDKSLQLLDEKYKAASAEMKEAAQAANEVGPPKDRYDPFRSQMARRQNMFMEQCRKILDDKEVLKRIDSSVAHNQVTLGSLVITTGHKVFFAISLGKVVVEGTEYFIASCETPVFMNMQNKKAGESFEMNGIKFEILEVW